jgi:uncharacterized protein (TIRG00374 family)
MMKAKLKTFITTLLKVGITGGLVYWLIHTGKLDLAQVWRLREPTTLITGLFLVYAGIFINNYRWQLLLRGQGLPVHMGSTLPLTHIGMFFNFAMPGGVGGDVFKGYYLVQDFPDRRLVAATSVLMDRLIGFYVMTGLGVAALLFDLDQVSQKPKVAILMLIIVGLFLAFTLFFSFALSKRVSRKLRLHHYLPKLPAGRTILKLYDVVHSYRNDLHGFFYCCGLSVVSQLFSLAVFMFFGHMLGGENIPWQIYALVVPVGLIATALPISIAGIGVGQTVFAQLFAWNLGYETPVAGAIITAYQVITFLFGLTGIYFYLRRDRPKSHQQVQPV